MDWDSDCVNNGNKNNLTWDKTYTRIVSSLFFALLGLVCNVYIAASCQCFTFSRSQILRCVCHKVVGNFCSLVVFDAIILWGLIWSSLYFILLEEHLKECVHKQHNILFVFITTYLSAL